MARLARVVAVDTPHHVTQRGNAHQHILGTDEDRAMYLRILQQASRIYRLSIVGYCLMRDHVHLVVIPRREDSLAEALKYAHGRFAAYYNSSRMLAGHVWQGRYYSCPLDTPHFWAALRYVELNPVRKGIAAKPEEYRWSSAPAHCNSAHEAGLLELDSWLRNWNPDRWRHCLAAGGSEVLNEAIRRNTHSVGRTTGRRSRAPAGAEQRRQAAGPHPQRAGGGVRGQGILKGTPASHPPCPCSRREAPRCTALMRT
jgi:putative transposase